MNKRVIEVIMNKRAQTIFVWAVALVVLCINAWFLFVRGAAYLDSDMAANFLNAVHNNEEHTIISQNWYYS